MYAERVFPELILHLSKSKTYLQTAVEYLNEIHKIESKVRVVAVMQCYDKKNENGRDGTKIDYFIGTREFHKIISDKFKPTINCKYEPKEWEVLCANLFEEINGKEKCINIMKRIARNANDRENIQRIELRMCAGGCMKGPAQLGEAINVFSALDKQNSRHNFKSVVKRKFNVRAKRNFGVEW